ncbi:MAG TPA: MarR family winged helix-turn-helix transcriptional regulator [Acidimicrobiales bacterium]
MSTTEVQPSAAAGERDAAALQRHLAGFVRAFGLHRPDETPCGAPVPVSEAHALSVLAERGPLTQTDLVHHLALGKSTVSRLVDQVVARGWAERTTSPDDARCRLVALTPAGRDAAAGLQRARAARFARLLDRIPPAERPVVLAALTTLTEAAGAS